MIESRPIFIFGSRKSERMKMSLPRFWPKLNSLLSWLQEIAVFSVRVKVQTQPEQKFSFHKATSKTQKYLHQYIYRNSYVQWRARRTTRAVITATTRAAPATPAISTTFTSSPSTVAVPAFSTSYKCVLGLDRRNLIDTNRMAQLGRPSRNNEMR